MVYDAGQTLTLHWPQYVVFVRNGTEYCQNIVHCCILNYIDLGLGLHVKFNLGNCFLVCICFRNDDEELVGFNYNINHLLCKVMNKKCEHINYYDARYCWDENRMSIGEAVPMI